jgi:hypothetical protein
MPPAQANPAAAISARHTASPNVGDDDAVREAQSGQYEFGYLIYEFRPL